MGLILGLLWGVFGRVRGEWGVGTMLVMGLVGWAISFFGPLLITALGGAAGGSIHNPRRSGAPKKRSYSFEESLEARGLYQEAIDAYGLAAGESPEDPTPYLSIARILRDRLERYEDAATWLRNLQRHAVMPRGQAFLVKRELVELYRHRMNAPAKAAPVLARMAEEMAGTEEGRWAEAELAEVRALIRPEADGPP